MDALDVPLLSLETNLGVFQIDADPVIFQIKACRTDERKEYILRNDMFPDFSERYSNVFDAIKAVANHRTGLRDWDGSDEIASDYLPDWKKQIDRRVQMRLLDSWLKLRPKSSIRDCVDYFERMHGYCMSMDRHVLRELFEELLVTGQLKELPSMRMAPSEMRSLTDLAKKCLGESTDSNDE